MTTVKLCCTHPHGLYITDPTGLSPRVKLNGAYGPGGTTNPAPPFHGHFSGHGFTSVDRSFFERWSTGAAGAALLASGTVVKV